MHKNQEVELFIHDLHSNGFGVGKQKQIDGDNNQQVVFVDGSLPGDHITAKIIKVKKHYAYGKMMELITSSPHRLSGRDPRICPVMTRCGGCQFQHLEYSAQLKFKEKLVKDALIRIGKCEDPPLSPILGMDTPYHYRNKAQFPVQTGNVVGLYSPRSHRLVPVTNCNIQHPICEEILNTVKQILNMHPIPIYEEETHKGLLRHVMIRVGFNTGDVMIVPVINGDFLPHKEVWIENLKAIYPKMTLVVNKNTAKTNVVLGPEFSTIYGSGHIYEEIGHVRYRISPRAFFQVNPAQTLVLYDTVLAHLTTNERVIDAYSGIGGIALYIASKVKKVVGIESVPEAVEDGVYNTVFNDVTNVGFLCGKAEELVPELLNQKSKNLNHNPNYDVIILDPPRKGCDVKLLESIVMGDIPKIIYVSCDPATMARDVNFLTERGYKLRHVQPVDMFPMTGHVESVVLLCRGDT